MSSRGGGAKSDSRGLFAALNKTYKESRVRVCDGVGLALPQLLEVSGVYHLLLSTRRSRKFCTTTDVRRA